MPGATSMLQEQPSARAAYCTHRYGKSLSVTDTCECGDVQLHEEQIQSKTLSK